MTRSKTNYLPDLDEEVLCSRGLTTLDIAPARSSRPPLKLVAMRTRAPDPTQQPIPIALEQRDERLDEQSFLRQRIALLEQALEDARRFAHHDHVTGIPNRRVLEDRFEHAKARSDRQRKSLALLFLDIDGFKQINDAHGHLVADDLLRRIATRLVGCIRTSDTVCRYGGDEFVILLPETDWRRGAISATRKIRKQLAAPYIAGAASIAAPMSIGMALYPSEGTELGSLIEKADSAMYREKASKRDQQYNPPQFRADLPRNSADGAAVGLERTRTRNKRESAYSLEADAFADEGATAGGRRASHRYHSKG